MNWFSSWTKKFVFSSGVGSPQFSEEERNFFWCYPEAGEMVGWLCNAKTVGHGTGVNSFSLAGQRPEKLGVCSQSPADARPKSTIFWFQMCSGHQHVDVDAENLHRMLSHATVVLQLGTKQLVPQCIRCTQFGALLFVPTNPAIRDKQPLFWISRLCSMLHAFCLHQWKSLFIDLTENYLSFSAIIAKTAETDWRAAATRFSSSSPAEWIRAGQCNSLSQEKQKDCGHCNRLLEWHQVYALTRGNNPASHFLRVMTVIVVRWLHVRTRRLWLGAISSHCEQNDGPQGLDCAMISCVTIQLPKFETFDWKLNKNMILAW